MPIINLELRLCNIIPIQVIQEKTSSNKFSCVVCGEKQSVIAVCARSSTAKDVRLAVQVVQLLILRGEIDIFQHVNYNVVDIPGHEYATWRFNRIRKG